MPRRLALAALTAVPLLTLAACSSGANASPANGAGTPGAQAANARGVGGSITNVSSATLQVQAASGQQPAIVSFGSSTTITDTVAASLADVKAGLCVTVQGTPATGSTTEESATLVELSEPVNGSCTGGFGGNGGQGRPSGAPSAYPSRAMPTDMPTRSPGMAGNPGMGAFGTVASVSGSSFTVTREAGQGAQASQGAQTSVTVTTNDQTKFLRRQAGTSSSLKAGRCVMAFGTTDDAGVTIATQLQVSDPVNGTCQQLAGGRGGFGGGRPTARPTTGG